MAGNTKMRFSEGLGDWKPVPAWAQFLMRFGHNWPRKNPRPRRISLVSMPCDSPAAGLVALGAMVRDLGDPKANDVDGHYDKLLNYARQFLQHCEPCDLKCKPAVKRCGYAREATGRLRSPLLPHGTVTISEKTDFGQRQIKWIQPDGHRNHALVIPTPQHVKNYHIDGEAPCQWNDAAGELPLWPYQDLFGVTIIPGNLRHSYSGLCFAGRLIRRKRNRFARAAVVAAHCTLAPVLAGEQHAARRRAHRRPGITLSEPHSLGGHRIQPRRLQFLLSKAPQVAVAQIISQDQHDIRFAWRQGIRGRRAFVRCWRLSPCDRSAGREEDHKKDASHRRSLR